MRARRVTTALLALALLLLLGRRMRLLPQHGRGSDVAGRDVGANTRYARAAVAVVVEIVHAHSHVPPAVRGGSGAQHVGGPSAAAAL